MPYGINPSQPPVLVEGQTACALIITNPKMFPQLGCGRGNPRRYRFTTRNERRPERLRMMARILAVLYGAADLLTLSDGQRIDGVCKPLTELQLAERLGIEPDEGAQLDHDTTGMRAMRDALRDLADAGFISYKQPKVLYCSEESGGCGKKVKRRKGGQIKESCHCGNRSAWRWRSLTTIITILDACIQAFGLEEPLEKAQKERYEEQQAGGPFARDIIGEREARRIVYAQDQAAKRAQLASEYDAGRAEENEARLARLYPKKKLE